MYYQNVSKKCTHICIINVFVIQNLRKVHLIMKQVQHQMMKKNVDEKKKRRKRSQKGKAQKSMITTFVNRILN